MAQVSTQTQLAAAIVASDPNIQIAANFNIDTQQNISYATTISSTEGGPYTLTKADGYEGALFDIRSGGSLALQNIILDGAKATHSISNNSTSLVRVYSGTLILDTGSVLQNNYATSGGAVYSSARATSPATVIVRGNATIQNNYAAQGGGGINVLLNTPGSGLHLSGQALIQNNEAVGRGGGIFRSSNQPDSFTIGDDVKIIGNRADSGGGLYCYGSGSLTGNVELSGNSATRVGGGIEFIGSSFLMADGVNIRNNHAGTDGGGVVMNQGPTNVAIHGTIESNTAVYGGGVYLIPSNSGTMDFVRARFVGNQAVTGNGGGLCIDNNSGGAAAQPITLVDTVFRSNQAGVNGGGMFLSYSENASFVLSADGVQFQDNTSGSNGGGAVLYGRAGSTARFQNCTFNKNGADSGGGLFLYNSDTEEFTVQLEDITLSGNVASTNGGALTLGAGSISAVLDNVVMEGSVVGTEGGGLCSAGGTGRIAIQGGSRFEGNLASASGGGIYHSGDRVLALTNAVIDQNIGGLGQGVYNDGPLELGPVSVVPDRLYLPDQDAVPMITEHLSWDSVVQLERSDYVTPNQTGTPIVVARSDLDLVGEDAVVFRTPSTGFAGWRFRVSDDRRQVLLTPAEYTLYYENTLGVENPNPIRYTEYTPTITLLPLENTTGNLFLGWYDAAEGGNQITQILQGSTGDKTLYARWQTVHTVTYYGNDAGGPAAENLPLPQQVPDGESILLSDERPTRTGYVFTGWNTDPGGLGTPYQPGETIPNVLEDIGLYAQWEALPPTLHLVTYEPNDAGGPSAQNMPEPQRFPEGEIAYLSAMIPTRTGYYFQSWNTRPDGAGLSYKAGDSLGSIYADLTLYAQWRQVEYTLTYHGNDEGGPPAQNIPGRRMFHFEDVFPLSDTVPTREGYRFTGWNTRPDGGGTAYQPGASFGPTIGNADLYAQWETLPTAQHLLTYEANDAGGPPAQGIPEQAEITEGDTADLSTAIPTRIGYRFLVVYVI